MELEEQSCFQMKKWLSEKNSIESIAMPAQFQVQVNRYSKTKLFDKYLWHFTSQFDCDGVRMLITYWIFVLSLFFNYWNLSKKMSLVNSFFIRGEKCFLFDHLLGNFHETCVQYSTFKFVIKNSLMRCLSDTGYLIAKCEK